MSHQQGQAPTLQDIHQARTALGKKQGFVAAARDLQVWWVGGWDGVGPELQAALLDATKRTHTLLQTRHTSRQAWREGLVLFETALSSLKAAHPLPHAEVAQAEAWVHTARDFLAENNHDREAEAPQAAPSPPDVFGAGAQEVDLASLLSRALAQGGGGDGGGGGNGDGGGSGGGGADDVVGSLLASLGVDLGSLESGPPPASREAKDDLRLRRVKPDEEATCAVCLEALYENKDSKAKEMPCKHLFHEQCLLEWLEKHNTCPTCRHALPSEKVHFDDVADAVAASQPAGIYA